MELDLSALDQLTAHARQREAVGEGKDTTEAKNAPEGLKTPFMGKHYLRLEAERETARRLSVAYREYQDNIKRSGQLVDNITKGIQEGENLYTLLLWSIEAIGRMTGNPLFYEQGKLNLQAIYGALGYDAPLEHRAQEVQERLTRLYSSLDLEQDPDARERIERAIREHRRRLAELEQRIANADR